jgi:Leucine Rich repeat
MCFQLAWNRPCRHVSRPWRRYLRLSVRGLIVIVLLVGAWFGWLVRSARIQREAAAVIEQAGGMVTYEFGWDDNPKSKWTDNSPPKGKPSAPKWLGDALGIDYFSRVCSVFFPRDCTDRDLVYIGRLTALEYLGLQGANVTDAGLAHLTGLSRLNELNLNGTQITDAGLAHLKGLSELSTLRLPYTQITDAGLVHLKGLAKLSELWLNGTQVTDAGVKDLQRALPNLTINR